MIITNYDKVSSIYRNLLESLEGLGCKCEIKMLDLFTFDIICRQKEGRYIETNSTFYKYFRNLGYETFILLNENRNLGARLRF